jgi:hypothetical protein
MRRPVQEGNNKIDKENAGKKNPTEWRVQAAFFA